MSIAKRALAGLAAIPIVLLGASICGVAIAGAGIAVEHFLEALHLSRGLLWTVAGFILLAVGLGADFGFRRVARAASRIPSGILQALSDAVLIIGIASFAVGCVFLVMSLFSRYGYQVWPLRASGGILVSASAVVILLRLRASRSAGAGPSFPEPTRNESAQALPLESETRVVAGSG